MLKTANLTLGVAIVLLTIGSSSAYGQQHEMPTGHPTPASGPLGAGQASASAGPGLSGLVTETMDVASYTYVQVDTGTESVWAAAPRFAVKVGDRVIVPTGNPMQNYRSDTLDRTFPLVYFAGRIPVTVTASKTSIVEISRPEGGHTVGEVFDQRESLAGKEVLIRARVVKFSSRIMGTNWLHVQDGTEGGENGSNDLVVTSDDTVAVGDLVLVRGKLSVDRDFGYGYKYELMLEAAKVTAE